MTFKRSGLVALSVLTLCACIFAVGDAPTDYGALGKQLVLNLAAGRFSKVEARFNARMSKALPEQKLPALWNGLIGNVGKFESIKEARSFGQNGFYVVDVACRFERAALTTQITFSSDGKVAGLFFRPTAPEMSWNPPSYARPSSFHEQSITVTDGRWSLPGTLTLPNGKGPFRAIVLVQGSGAHDEDETIGPNEPFKDLAWGLASRGIAVLRYMKRTLKYPQIIEQPGFTVMQEYVDDARAAAGALASDPAIDSKYIFVLGHSQGGTLAPRIAQHDPQIAGIILMAGATESLEKAAVRQLTYVAGLHGKAAGPTETEIKEVEAEAREIESPSLKSSDGVTFLGQRAPASYFLDLRAYHPATTAARLRIPILVLQGGRDYNVTVADDFDAWKRALSGHPGAEFKFYPDLDHLFMTGSQPPVPQDFFKPGHVSAQVISDIAQWVDAQKGSKESLHLKKAHTGSH